MDLISSGQSDDTLSYEILPAASFRRRGIRKLFDKIDVIGDTAAQDKVLSQIDGNSPVLGLMRLLLFSSYFMQYVVLTRVETDDENAAFDIFDALNTTGEPLTAVETLKPRVIQYEKQAGEGSGFSGSPSEQAFDRIEKYISEKTSDPDTRQNRWQVGLDDGAYAIAVIRTYTYRASLRWLLRSVRLRFARVV